jgi:hypothetical protein
MPTHDTTASFIFHAIMIETVLLREISTMYSSLGGVSILLGAELPEMTNFRSLSTSSE